MGTKMSLAEFYKYARNNRKRIDDIYREIEEIQYQFNDLYSQQVQERDKLITAHVPLLLNAPDDSPIELRQVLQTKEQEERKSLQKEIARLGSEIALKRQTADGLIQEAQRQVAHLREQNPILDQQEEELKARQASMQSRIEELGEEIRITSVLSFVKRRRLSREREQLVANLEPIKAGIRAVREEWQVEKTKLQETQTDLQSRWETASVEIAQMQARMDYLVANFDQESRRIAAQNLLGDLNEAPPIEGPWRNRLSALVELNVSKLNYETGLTSVAEILGLLKGLAEGMDRFIRSVATVYEEQRRYKLPPLTLNLPDTVTSFHTVWSDFQSQVKDEKYLGTHPLEFNRRIQTVVQEQINEDDIQKMFDDMGEALTKATKAWR